jgi:predicted hydrocarbon binding protein
MNDTNAAATDALGTERLTLQHAMSFLGALASGIEDAVGDEAMNVTRVAGKDLGKRLSAGAAGTDHIETALEEVRQVLRDNRCMWCFEAFQPKSRPQLIEHTAEGDEIMLVFRDCMIRQSLFRFGHAQKGSLCNIMNGFFAGALENIMGRRSQLTIVHAGENACYKRLLVQEKV